MDPSQSYPRFYTNPVVQDLADIPRWTVSTNEKVPIDFRELMLTGRVKGAKEATSNYLVTLDEITDFLPDASNSTLYLRSQVDGYAVLDIEPSCPPEISAELLKLPALYAEESMSGKGYHLVLPLPDNFMDYPIATQKKTLSEEHNWYEILLEHWITFSRVTIDTAPDPTADWEELYASLAQHAVISPTAHLDLSNIKPEIPNEEMILRAMTTRPFSKDPGDFHHDMSRYEFFSLGVLRSRMTTCIREFRTAYPATYYGHTEQVWLLYEAAKAVFIHRDKHDEMRNGMPLLFDRASLIISLNQEPT